MAGTNYLAFLRLGFLVCKRVNNTFPAMERTIIKRDAWKKAASPFPEPCGQLAPDGFILPDERPEPCSIYLGASHTDTLVGKSKTIGEGAGRVGGESSSLTH